ncbi:MAG: cysteine desulfurase [Gammaproteobacteria bacterium]|uniref:aminotransferase class V-fold PLP-dependent enzyme n=1 Tax=Pseudomaricurvus alcaniphilus TaxID=1166482 RepID=UPI00140C4F48|nr:cysteine desulfurase [Pseudomaricurvus alcaniphilus]MBR9911197.1 cysteine desulfurase [Gammaproteobacteria bacterium]NHN37576.1 cysteine desulfurase [Pseudomaricurvus alcaniphilus]
MTAADFRVQSAFDVQALREQFPILSRTVDGKPLVYLDNAATTQKPQCVIDAIVDYYSNCNSNVHRGAHRLADEATQKYEGARDIVAGFINARAREEVVWTSGTTEAINIVAHGIASRLQAGDEILVTEMEHHANLVTWQQACQQSGASLKIAPINEAGELQVEAFRELLSPATRLVAFPQVSNALGTINPVEELCQLARQAGALVLVDGAQGVAHGDIDVQAMGCDFYAFSGHKIFGPTGIGVLWGKQELLQDWPVWKTGGEMIAEVTYQSAVWNTLPYRLEAGTPHIAGVIGLGEAIRWFSQLDLAAVQAHEAALMERATRAAEAFDGLTIVGRAARKIGVLSFLMQQGHPADIGFLLDRQGIAIRTGHHCAQPLMGRLGVPGTARASFSIYNTLEEVDALFAGLKKVRTMLD